MVCLAWGFRVVVALLTEGYCSLAWPVLRPLRRATGRLVWFLSTNVIHPDLPAATARLEQAVCSNGFPGTESSNSNGIACCELDCINPETGLPACGGQGCRNWKVDDGRESCCIDAIVREGDNCATTGAAPCFIDPSDTRTCPLVLVFAARSICFSPSKSAPGGLLCPAPCQHSCVVYSTSDPSLAFLRE